MSAILERLLATGFGIYLSIVGTGLGALAAGLAVKRIRINAGERADGRIVGYTERMKQHVGDRPQFMPRVSFHPRGGPAVEFQSRMGADPKRWPEGTPVPVAYRADRPQDAEIASWARLWLAPIVIALMAGGCLALAWRVGG